MSEFPRSAILRYGVAIATFAILLFIPYGLQRLFSFNFDTTFLIIIAMIASAWYLGRGPGLLIAVAFEAALVFFSQPGFTARAIIITINRLVLFVSVVVFASARRASEIRLREQRKLLQVTLSSIGDAVIATDVDGKISFLNPAAEVLTGWDLESSRQKPLDEVFRIVNEQTREIVESPFAKIKREGAVMGLANNTLLLKRDGTEVPIEDSGAPIRDADGKIVGTVIVFHDVTGRRLAERDREALLRSEQAARREAEAANRMKDEFLATVSHELRTPLNAILGWTGLLQQELPDAESLKNALDVIERNAKAQNKLIGDVLDVSRIVSGKMMIDAKPLMIVPLVRSAVDSVFPASVAKGVEISANYDGTDSLVLGDPERLQQVFWNILSNAIKFTASGGMVKIDVAEAAGNVEVTIGDTGVGISPEDLRHVFERFHQIDSSTKRSHGGLGLGLAIVRHLVELHGGTVSAESSGTGKGTTFRVSLPVAKDVTISSSDRPELSDNSRLRGVKILVVDDNADSLEMCCVSLEQLGAQIRSATTCAAALEIFAHWRPDVLISDLGMPGEDGFDLIKRVRSLSSEQGGDIPAAALTAYARNEDRDLALNAGFQAHISKPVEIRLLAEEISRLLNGHK